MNRGALAAAARAILDRLPRNVRMLVTGSIWLTVAAGWSQGSMLLANVAVANLLGAFGYGRYALLQSLIVGLGLISQAGFGLVISQRMGALRTQDALRASQTATFCLAATCCLSAGIGTVLLIWRDAIADGVFGEPSLGPGVGMAALAIPWLAINHVQNGIFSGLEEFRRQAGLSLWTSPAVLVLPAIGAGLAGEEGAVIGLACVYFLRLVVSQLVLRRLASAKGLHWSLKGIQSNLQMVWRAALPATLAGVFGWAGVWGGHTLLIRSEGGAPALGLFAAAFTIKMIIVFFASQTSIAVLPILARVRTGGEAGEARGVLISAVAGALAVTVSLAGLVAIFAEGVMGLFGDEFAGGGHVLRILMLVVPLEALTINLFQGLFANGFYWRAILSETLPRSVLLLLTALLLVPTHQAEGLAWAWVVGWSAALLGTVLSLLWSRSVNSSGVQVGGPGTFRH